MKDKNMAGILALLGGSIGAHRFYLGQTGLGILYLVFFWVAWIVGIIDAIVLFSMDQDDFDRKYNPYLFERVESGPPRRYQRAAAADRRTSSSSQPAQVRDPQARYSTTRTTDNPYRNEGVKSFKEYDYDAAIESFERSLEVTPRDIATHFNLACSYSVTEQKDKAFYHLDRAVAFGFNDWARIKEHDALAYLRVQPEFERFESNGFQLAPQLAAPQPDLLASMPQSGTTQAASGDLLEQLQRLGDLRDKGLLTDAEFTAQKHRLLG